MGQASLQEVSLHAREEVPRQWGQCPQEAYKTPKCKMLSQAGLEGAGATHTSPLPSEVL